MKTALPSLPPVIQQPKDRLIVALSVRTVEEACALIDSLSPYTGGFAIGPHFSTEHRIRLSDLIRKQNQICLLDLKVSHAPEIAAWTIEEAIAQSQPHFITVRIGGGAAMIDQTVRAAREMKQGTRILVDTFMHSQTDADFLRIVGSEPERKMLAFAGDAKLANADGILCATQKLLLIRDIPTTNRFYRIGTGIHLDPVRKGDPICATPIDALRANADYLLVGKDIVQDTRPLEKAKRYTEEIGRALRAIANEPPPAVPQAVGA